tara:strand:- start:52475 stop:52903 length:429 start_codon:yes stop_codon:yes gene_type:complete
MKYSPKTNGFYLEIIHGDNIPVDAVEVTDEHYYALMAGQVSGQSIQAGSDGHPILADPILDFEALKASRRAERDARIQAVAWRFERHTSELLLIENGVRTESPTDDDPTMLALHVYVQELRDVPEQAGFPEAVTWPVYPLAL